MTVPQPIDTTPLNFGGRESYSEYRLTHLINQLTDRLQNWLDICETGASIPVVPPRIGLFGGLGQGKSTVITCVLENLIKTQNDKNKKYYQRLIAHAKANPILRFDVSCFKTNDLEWRFLLAVFLHSFKISFLYLLLGPISLVCAFFYMSGAPSFFVALFGGVATMYPIFTKLAGSSIFTTVNSLIIQWIAKFLNVLPCIVIVDDLDRATTDQQRSFLRSLNRFSYQLGFAVIVCMDETLLLSVPPDPETPQELLRKVISEELHIPDRTKEDILLLCIACIREFRNNNRQLAFIKALEHIQFVSDFARTLLLLGPPSQISPRQVRHLLNRVAMQAKQLNISKLNDLSALLRVEGFLELTAKYRYPMAYLCEAMEKNSVVSFKSFLEKANIPKSQHKSIVHFLLHTRMMQPELHKNWYKLTSSVALFIHEQEQSAKYHSSWIEPWGLGEKSYYFFHLFAETIEFKVSGFSPNEKLRHRKHKPEIEFSIFDREIEKFSINDLPSSYWNSKRDLLFQTWLIWVVYFVMSPPHKKSLLYRYAYEWVNAHKHLDDDNLILHLFWREILADCDLWKHMKHTPGIRDFWWENIQKDSNAEVAINKFLTIPLDDTDFELACWLISQPGTRDWRAIINWWSEITPRFTDSTPYIDWKGRHDLIILKELWPPPSLYLEDTHDCFSSLKAHIVAITNLRRVLKGNAHTVEFLVPTPILTALNQAQYILTIDQYLDLLYILAYAPDAPPDMRWTTSVERWVDGLNESIKLMLQDILATPAQYNTLTDERALLLFFISAIKSYASHEEEELAFYESTLPDNEKKEWGWSYMQALDEKKKWIPSNPQMFFRRRPLEECRLIANTLYLRGAIPQWLTDEFPYSMTSRGKPCHLKSERIGKTGYDARNGVLP